MTALAAAGLEIEEGNPGANPPPAQQPLRDEPQENQLASSVAFSSTESPPPVRVRSDFAAAQAFVWQVLNEVRNSIQTWSLPCTSPTAMQHWHDV